MSDTPMTAPTLPEPRPDDEGRETAVLNEAELELVESDGPPFTNEQAARLGGVLQGRPFSCPSCGQAMNLTDALTPHPAPLGATDEGLREAVRAFLASWDAMAPFTTRDAPMIAALRAALQAGG